MIQPSYYILANADRIRVVQSITGDPAGGSIRPRVHLGEVETVVADIDPNEASDRPGRFEKGKVAGQRDGLVQGERHGAKAEAERRRAKALAASISKLVGSESPASWGLVAPGSWLPKIEAVLDSGVAQSLSFRQAADLTHEPLASLETRLLAATAN